MELLGDQQPYVGTPVGGMRLPHAPEPKQQPEITTDSAGEYYQRRAAISGYQSELQELIPKIAFGGATAPDMRRAGQLQELIAKNEEVGYGGNPATGWALRQAGAAETYLNLLKEVGLIGSVGGIGSIAAAGASALIPGGGAARAAAGVTRTAVALRRASSVSGVVRSYGAAGAFGLHIGHASFLDTLYQARMHANDEGVDFEAGRAYTSAIANGMFNTAFGIVGVQPVMRALSAPGGKGLVAGISKSISDFVGGKGPAAKAAGWVGIEAAGLAHSAANLFMLGIGTSVSGMISAEYVKNVQDGMSDTDAIAKAMSDSVSQESMETHFKTAQVTAEAAGVFHPGSRIIGGAVRKYTGGIAKAEMNQRLQEAQRQQRHVEEASGVHGLVSALSKEAQGLSLSRNKNYQTAYELSVAKRAGQVGKESLYVDYKVWNDYWGAQGKDPRAEYIRIAGKAEAYDHVAPSQAQLMIPTHRYASQIAANRQHADAFNPHMKSNPSAPTPTEIGLVPAKAEAAKPPPIPREAIKERIASEADARATSAEIAAEAKARAPKADSPHGELVRDAYIESITLGGIEPLMPILRGLGAKEKQSARLLKATEAARTESIDRLASKEAHRKAREESRGWEKRRQDNEVELRDKMSQEPFQELVDHIVHGRDAAGRQIPASERVLLDSADLANYVGGAKNLDASGLGHVKNGITVLEAAWRAGMTPTEFVRNIRRAPHTGDRAIEESFSRTISELGRPVDLDAARLWAVERMNGPKARALNNMVIATLAKKASDIGALFNVATTKPKPHAEMRRVAEAEASGLPAHELKRMAQGHEKAAETAAREAVELAAKGDVVGAIEALVRRGEAMERGSAVQRLREEITSAEVASERAAHPESMNRLRRISANAEPQSAAAELEMAMRSLQAMAGSARAESGMMGGEALREWARRYSNESGVYVHIPEGVGNSPVGQAKNLPAGQILDIHNAIKSVSQAGRTANSLFEAGVAGNLAEARAIVGDAVRLARRKAGETVGVGGEELGTRGLFDALNSANKARRSAAAWLIYPEFIIERIGNWNPQSRIKKLLFDPWVKADNAKRAMNKDVTTKADAIVGRAFGKKPNWRGEARPVEGLARDLAREQRIMAMLYAGSASGKDALKQSHRWGDAQIEAIRRSASKEERRFVQDVHDLFESYWDTIVKHEASISGKKLQPVEAEAWSMDGETYRGGYMQLRSNKEASLTHSGRATSGDIHDIVGGHMADPAAAPGYQRSRVRRASGQVLEMSVDGIGHRLAEMVHDLTHRKTTIDAWKMLNDPAIQRDLVQAVGKAAHGKLLGWVKSNAGVRPVEPSQGLASAFAKLRTGGVISKLVWNLGSGVSQLAGLPIGAKEVGVRWMARGIADVYGSGDPAKVVQNLRNIREMSPQQAGRHSGEFHRDIYDWMQRSKIIGKSGQVLIDIPGMPSAARDFRLFCGLAQELVDAGIWKGGYMRAMSGAAKGVPSKNHEAAVQYADRAVRTTQGHGAGWAQPAYARGGELFRMFTSFMTPMSAVYNQFVKMTDTALVARWGRDAVDVKNAIKGLGEDAGAVLSGLALLWVAPAMMDTSLRGRGDPERLRKAVTAWPFETVPFLREASDLIKYGWQPEDSMAMDILGRGASAMHKASQIMLFDEEAEKEKPRKERKSSPKWGRHDTKNVAHALGGVLGLPVLGVEKPAETLYYWITGRLSVESPFDIAAGFSRGVRREHLLPEKRKRSSKGRPLR